MLKFVTVSGASKRQNTHVFFGEFGDSTSGMKFPGRTYIEMLTVHVVIEVHNRLVT